MSLPNYISLVVKVEQEAGSWGVCSRRCDELDMRPHFGKGASPLEWYLTYEIQRGLFATGWTLLRSCRLCGALLALLPVHWLPDFSSHNAAFLRELVPTMKASPLQMGPSFYSWRMLIPAEEHATQRQEIWL